MFKDTRNKINNKNYNFITNKEKTTIQVASHADCTTISKLLKDLKINFFTSTPKGEKPISLIIKNFPHCYKEEDLKNALSETPIKCNVKKIIKLKTNWLVQFDKESDIDSVKKIEYLNLHRVFIENY